LLAKKVLIVAVCVSSLLSLALVIPSSAQAQKPIIIASGESTGYNINTTGAAPEKYYQSSPPLMIAAKVGSGAVAAAGIASTCRDNRWNNPDNPDNNLDVLLDKAFQWMTGKAPSATKVLWYEGYSVYNTITTSPVQCANLRNALQAKGYTLTGDATMPITTSLLAPYDILVIPQLELPVTATGTGGDPSLLPDADVQAIVSFVEGGKGLFIMDQSDYAGHNFSNVQNKILDALGVGFYFQDDQAQDDTNKWGQATYQPIAVIDTTTDIGSAFQSATGKSEIGLYDICSLRIQENYDVSVTILPTVNVAQGGQTTTYTATITNIGLKPDNYSLTVSDLLGWSLSLSQSSVSVENGENAGVTVSVTVPSNLTAKVVDWVTVTASGVLGGETENAQVRAINVFPKTGPGYPTVPVGPGFLGPGLPDLTVENSASVVTIVTGIGSGYSNDITPREPQPILYGMHEYPPVCAAAFVDNGRVVVMPNSILRDAYFDRAELSNDEMMSDIVRWIINWENPENNPANGEPFNFTYLVTGPGVYHTNAIVSKYLAMLGALGFNVSYAADTSVSLPVIITPSLLANVDVLHINEVDRALSTDEIQAIVNWVKAGGKLIIGCQADYGGYGLPAYPNAVLEALNVPVRFQDDELYDDNSWVIDGPWYPQVDFLDVRQVNPNFDVWFPAINFTAGMSVRSLTANNVQVIFPFTITNTGTRSSSYKIEVQETSSTGWSVNWWPTEVSVASGENIGGYIAVTVPEIEVGKKRMDLLFTVTDQTLTSLTKTITCAALGDNSIKITPAKFENGQSVSTTSLGKVTIINLGYSGGTVGWTYVVQTTGGENKVVPETLLSPGPSPGGQGFPIWIIAVVVVVIVVVVAGGYFAMRKKSSPGKGQ
jgi:uncharacterized repeat protein (TIGR01451 family)